MANTYYEDLYKQKYNNCDDLLEDLKRIRNEINIKMGELYSYYQWPYEYVESEPQNILYQSLNALSGNVGNIKISIENEIIQLDNLISSVETKKENYYSDWQYEVERNNES